MGGEAIGGLLALAIVLFLLWYLAYSAASSAVAEKRTVFAANIDASADAVHFTLANLGTQPGFSVAVRWSDLPGGEPLARVACLGPLKPLEWDHAAAAIPDETWSSRTLAVTWQVETSSGANVRRTHVDVLAPSRLDLPPFPNQPDL